MKKLISLLLATVMLLSFASCSADTNGDKKDEEKPVSTEAKSETETQTKLPEEEPEDKKVLENDIVKLDGFYVDKSYQDDDGSPLKMVYVFLTFKANDTNYEVDSKYVDIKIGNNTYSSDFYKRACSYMPNYYYSSFIEDIYVGTECKLALTFKIPEGDLSAGKNVSLNDSSLEIDGLSFSTDDLVSCGSVAEIGKLVDPEGAAGIIAKKELADDSTRDKVRQDINGYYFDFYVSAGTSILRYKLEFYAPNNFDIYINNSYVNSGAYEVRNGYIFLYYNDSDTAAVEIAYDYDSGDISLYCSDAFNIYQ